MKAWTAAVLILVAAASGLTGLSFRCRARGLEYRLFQAETRVAELAERGRLLDLELGAGKTPGALVARARARGLLAAGAGFLVREGAPDGAGLAALQGEPGGRSAPGSWTVGSGGWNGD